jgi:hypothetical protein
VWRAAPGQHAGLQQSARSPMVRRRAPLAWPSTLASQPRTRPRQDRQADALQARMLQQPLPDQPRRRGAAAWASRLSCEPPQQRGGARLQAVVVPDRLCAVREHPVQRGRGGRHADRRRPPVAGAQPVQLRLRPAPVRVKGYISGRHRPCTTRGDAITHACGLWSRVGNTPTADATCSGGGALLDRRLRRRHRQRRMGKSLRLG